VLLALAAIMAGVTLYQVMANGRITAASACR
jgi:hypothetical protein